MTSKPLLVAGLLGTMLLSGCTFPGGGPCVHLGAVWEEDGIWEAFPAPGAAPGWTIEHSPLPEGLPFDHAGLDAAWSANVSLTQVSWEADTAGIPTTFSLWPGGLVEAVLPDRLRGEEVRDLFHGFARDLVDANESQMGRWANTFVITADLDREEEHDNTTYRMMRHSVLVDGPYQLEGHYDALELEPDEAAFDTTLSAGSWNYHFSLPERHAAREIQQGEMHRVTVNVLNGTHASVVAATEDLDAARNAIIEGLAALDIDARGPEDDQFHPSASC